MPHPIIATDTYIEINIGGRKARINYADLPGNTAAKLANALKIFLQDAIDTRLVLADLPDDEPTKTVNPDAPNFFWGQSDGSVHPNPARNDTLIARDTIITDVVWDGTRYSVKQVTAPHQ